MGPVQTTIRELITWVQLHDLAFRHYKLDWNVLLTLTVDSPFCLNIRHSNEGQLKAVKLEHPLADITWLYHGLIFLPIEVPFFVVFQQYFIWSRALSIPENLAIMWPYTDRLTDRTTGIQCLILNFLDSLGACSLIFYVHVTIHVVISWDSCQNSVSAYQYRLTVLRAQVSTHWVRVLFWNYPLTSYYFSNYCRLKFNFC